MGLPSFTDFWIAFNRLRIWLFPPSEMKGSHGKDVAETTSSVTDRYVASPPRRRRPGTSVQEMRYEVNKPREMSMGTQAARKQVDHMLEISPSPARDGQLSLSAARY